jgi:antitoxin MazE
MKAHLVQIGNSRGIRLPKPLIEQAGLGNEVELQVQDGAIVISRADKKRTGWAEAAAALAQDGEDALLDEPTPTRFDEEEWQW